ncbi:c-type cytochrome biogenesis protein CcmI [Salinisphaera japonica]|uniref:C-type cytochrome biogenesis protein CcmI n=1 Tax=Salinisphaera japonica YTM-1 TaxID=1209778 RepID=A0A423Q298_9GAMM|nr:c-type cytochrome biogenesis protein CcmI [Salinisphaera japonica]ROO32782.1 hypothetical protein SAJA_00660 [Salinisphaera japonica YTM-1]
MIGFVVIAVAMITLCAGLAVVPLWRGAGGEQGGLRRRETNIDAYRQRVREIDADVAAGRLDASNAGREKEALGTRLVADVDTTSTVGNLSLKTQRPWLASALALVLVTASGTLGYYWLGNYDAIARSDRPNIDALVAELAQQVEAHPNDRGARLMLIRVYESRGAFSKAADQLAYINARATVPVPDLLVAEARARLKAGAPINGRAGSLFERALAQDSDNIAALWFCGLRAAQAGDDTQALALWDRLLALDVPADVRDMVQARRRALAGELPSL